MDYHEDDYDKMSHDQLLALADRDRLAAEAYYSLYHDSADPVQKAEAHKILRSLVVDFEARSFWADWYYELLFSSDPSERSEAEEWRQKIIREGVFGREDLIAMRIIAPDDEYVERIE